MIFRTLNLANGSMTHVARSCWMRIRGRCSWLPGLLWFLLGRLMSFWLARGRGMLYLGRCRRFLLGRDLDFRLLGFPLILLRGLGRYLLWEARRLEVCLLILFIHLSFRVMLRFVMTIVFKFWKKCGLYNVIVWKHLDSTLEHRLFV